MIVLRLLKLGALSVIIVIVIIAADYALQKPHHVSARVVRVIDGDTIVAQIGGVKRRVRLLGIDTPETVKPGAPVECFGRQASAASKKRLAGKRVQLTYGRLERRDNYGRLLAFVDYRGDDHGAWLIKQGYARAYYPGANNDRRPRYEFNQLIARALDRGMWGKCRSRGRRDNRSGTDNPG